MSLVVQGKREPPKATPDQTPGAKGQVPKKKIKRTQIGSPAIVYGDPATPISESLAKADVASHSSAEATSESGLPS